MNKLSLLLAHSFFLVALLLTACSKPDSNELEVINLDTIETVSPELITSYDSIGEKYFSYLGLDSFVNEDGEIIVTVWDPAEIYLTNESGDSLIASTMLGRGPGEFLSTGQPTKDAEGNLYFYDQRQIKVVVLDSNLDLIKEFKPNRPEDGSFSRLFPLSENKSIVEINDNTWNTRLSSDNYVFLASYNPETNIYSKSRRIQDRPMAKMFREGGMAAGAFQVPFSAGHYLASNHLNNTIYSFYAGSNVIAELDSNLDTLRTIAVNLPTEPMSQEEIDDIFSDSYNEEYDNLRDLLPEIKNPVNNMKVDDEGRIWLESTLSGEKTSWFVLNSKGEVLKRVMLPKNSYLTHIHKDHLGIRLDETTLALYESVSFEE